MLSAGSIFVNSGPYNVFEIYLGDHKNGIKLKGLQMGGTRKRRSNLCIVIHVNGIHDHSSVCPRINKDNNYKFD